MDFNSHSWDIWVGVLGKKISLTHTNIFGEGSRGIYGREDNMKGDRIIIYHIGMGLGKGEKSILGNGVFEGEIFYKYEG